MVLISGLVRRLSPSVQRMAPGRLFSGWRSLTAHHGLWGPGVRLLRNMNLRRKSALVFLCILLPLAVSLYETVRTRLNTLDTATRSQRSLALAQALTHWQLATHAMVSAQAPGAADLAVRQRFQAAEGAAFEDLRAKVQAVGDDEPVLAGEFEQARRSRQVLLQQAGDVAGALDALAAHNLEIQTLRSAVERSWITTLGRNTEDDQHNKALRMVFAVHVPELLPTLLQLADRNN